MNAETKTILMEMGFNFDSNLRVPNHDNLGMDLSIVRRGSAVSVYCSNEAEYDTLANHGAIIHKHDEESRFMLAFHLGKEKLFPILRSVAVMRVLNSGDKTKIKRHQKLANNMAKNWLANMPLALSSQYGPRTTLDEYRLSA